MASALLTDEVLAALPAWMSHRRWFATKNEPINAIEVLSEDPLPLAAESGRVEHVIMRVHTTDRSDDYQLLIASAPREYVEANVTPDHVIYLADQVVYEAFGDQHLLLSLQERFREGARLEPLTFHTGAWLEAAHSARLISSEQSNSSVIYGDQAIAKFYRRLTPGLNPDLEIGLALDRLGSPHTPEVLSWLEGELEGQQTTLAVVHRFLATAIDGFEHALSSVRDLIASPGIEPDQAGGDFSGEAQRLGEAVASVHGALAEGFGTSMMDDADVARLIATMNAKLDQALAIVPELAPFDAALRSIYDSIQRVEVPLQRIHGDLHLGQVLRDTSGWMVLDFEGEPGTALEERRRPAPALRDVAGMLRSFDYAARQPLIGHPSPQEHLERTARWAERNRAHFLTGYLSVLPQDLGHDATLMRALEAEKAVYETVYEQRFRPDWLPVPLGGIERLVEQQ